MMRTIQVSSWIRSSAGSHDSASSSRRGLGRGAGIYLAALFVVLSACGRKGDPIPPPSKVPAAPPDLVAQQQGSDIVLHFSYPTVTEGGLPLTEIESVSVLRYQRPAPELAIGRAVDLDAEGEEAAADAAIGEEVMGDEVMGDEPESSPAESEVDVTDEQAPDAQVESTPAEAEVSDEGGGDEADDAGREDDLLTALLGDEAEVDTLPPLPRVDRNTFASQSGVILEIPGVELGRYVDGNRVVVRLTDEEFHSDPWIHAYGVIVRGNGRNSAPSNIAVVSPIVPPPAITTTEVDGSEDGIRIRWQLLDDETISSYNVYRRSVEEPAFGEAFGSTAPDQAWFVDTSAEMGSRWVYAVTAVGSREVESPWGNQKEIYFRDVYPPPVPTALVAIPDAEGVRLLWRHQPTDDHRGYVVTRAHAEITEVLTENPVSGLEFTDRTASSGTEYTYHAVAVDEAGNSSEASEPVTVVAP